MDAKTTHLGLLGSILCPFYFLLMLYWIRHGLFVPFNLQAIIMTLQVLPLIAQYFLPSYCFTSNFVL
jgi:hypothetical protein